MINYIESEMHLVSIQTSHAMINSTGSTSNLTVKHPNLFRAQLMCILHIVYTEHSEKASNSIFEIDSELPDLKASSIICHLQLLTV